MDFWMIILGLLTVIAGLGVVLARKPLNSALCLVVTLFLLACHFALLDAHFVAAIQVLVYAGAIMVLVIFVIMLLGLNSPGDEKILKSPWTWVYGAFGFGLVSLIVAYSLLEHRLTQSAQVASAVQQDLASYGSTEQIGKLLFEKFIFQFEITSVLLLAAIVGAVALALEAKQGLPAGRGLSAVRKTNHGKKEQPSESSNR
ncbi:NADH-quinone oxidoreductase subunit J [bacterium]|nr:NADH-quinone oxidoreductase subunit J [bacterium]